MGSRKKETETKQGKVMHGRERLEFGLSKSLDYYEEQP